MTTWWHEGGSSSLEVVDANRFDQPEELVNHATPFTTVTIAFWFLLMWVGFALAVGVSFDENSFTGWGNVASRATTMLGVAWVFFVLFISWLFNWVMGPPSIRIGPDSFEGTPPRLSRRSTDGRSIVIRFDELKSVGWNLLGPSAVGSPGKPGGPIMLLTVRNAKVLRAHWAAWKGRREAPPTTGISRNS